VTRPKQEQELDWDRVDDKDVAWAVMKERLGNALLAFWIRTYHEKSLTFRNPKKGHDIKITVEGHVHHDRRIGNGEYKSAKYVMPTIDEATRKVLELMVA
jgi:hypothetical protein